MKKGAIFSEEHKKRLRESHLGKIPWNKGKKGIYSEETLKKIRETQKIKQLGHPVSEETKEKIRKKRLGMKFGPMSEEHKQKISKANKGKPYPKNRKSRKGTPIGFVPLKAFKKGNKPWNYIDGRSNRINSSKRYGKEWPKIRQNVLERDGHICQKCKSDGIYLEVHHIIPYYLTKDNSFNNLISLCKKCHRQIEAEEMRLLKGKNVA